jgi:hypothetical protein
MRRCAVTLRRHYFIRDAGAFISLPFDAADHYARAAIHIACFRPPCRYYVSRCAMMLAPTMIFARALIAALCCRAMPLIAIFEAFDIADYAISYIDVRMPFLPMMRAAITPFSLMPPCRHYCCH